MKTFVNSDRVSFDAFPLFEPSWIESGMLAEIGFHVAALPLGAAKRRQGVRAYSHDAATDFYPTPSELTLALLQREKFEGLIWECACATGENSKLLPKESEVLSTDLYDWGYGQAGIDFLRTDFLVDNIVTNPPFSRWTAFKLKALKSARKKVALLSPLVNMTFDCRSENPPRTVYILPDVDWWGEHTPYLGVGWYVYDIGFQGNTSFVWVNL